MSISEAFNSKTKNKRGISNTSWKFLEKIHGISEEFSGISIVFLRQKKKIELMSSGGCLRKFSGMAHYGKGVFEKIVVFVHKTS